MENGVTSSNQKKFKKTFFIKNDINKLILLLRKGVYPYGYMDEWKEFTETPLSKEFYNNLYMGDIIDAD